MKIYEDRIARADRDGDKVGLKSGLRWMEAWDELLYNNYEAQLTDRELEDKMIDDFPHHELRRSASWYRSYFNRGVFGLGWKNQRLSGSYRLPQFKNPLLDGSFIGSN